jgi:hypothetical protein
VRCSRLLCVQLFGPSSGSNGLLHGRFADSIESHTSRPTVRRSCRTATAPPCTAALTSTASARARSVTPTPARATATSGRTCRRVRRAWATIRSGSHAIAPSDCCARFGLVGGYPPLLNSNHPLYSDDKIQECMNRCLDAVGLDEGRAAISPRPIPFNMGSPCRDSRWQRSMTARPSPTMRLEFSEPFLESLNGKRQYFPGERSQKLQTNRRSAGTAPGARTRSATRASTPGTP